MENLRELTTREANLKWWAFFCIVLGTLHYLVYHSTQHAYPEMLKMTVGVAIIVIVSAAYNHSLGNEPDRLVRNVALAGMFLIVMSDVATLYGHVAMGRDISAARAGESERRSREKFETDQFKEKADTVTKLMETQAQLNASQAQLERAQANKLNALPPDMRRQQARKLKPATSTDTGQLSLPSLLATPAPTTTSQSNETEVMANKTEAQVKADWRDYLTTVLLLQVVIAFLSTFGTKAVKMYDADGNKVPDYVERIWKRDRKLATELYPKYARILDAEAMGNA